MMAMAILGSTAGKADSVSFVRGPTGFVRRLFDFFIRSQYTSTLPQWLFLKSSPTIFGRSGPAGRPSSREEDMPKYVIERDIPQIGNVTPDQVIAISQKSCSVLNTLGPKIQWVHSYVTQDRIYCVYIAPNEEMVREHARQGGFPANRISEVKLTIDPTSAEA
jgi:hypothetical protein